MVIIRMADDEEFCQKMREAIKDNRGYCPRSPFRTKNTKCICREFLNIESGTCNCGLYIKEVVA